MGIFVAVENLFLTVMADDQGRTGAEIPRIGLFYVATQPLRTPCWEGAEAI